MKHFYTLLVASPLLLAVVLIVTLMPQSACVAQAQGATFCPPTNGTITTSFSSGHQALDISGASGFVQGPAVYAPYDGTIVYIGIAEPAGNNANSVKHALAINHGMVNGTYVLSFYVHMGSTTQSYIPANLSVGMSVSRGQLIGYQGFTGQASGTHLHWELHEYSQPFLNRYTSWGRFCNRNDLWWEFGGNVPGEGCNNPNPARAVTPEKYAGSMPLGSQVSASCAVAASKMEIDSPGNGQTIAGQLIVSGWAIHQAAASGTGIDAVHVYFDGPAGSGARGVAATYGVRRDDVAAAYGDRYRYAGYQLEDSSAVLSIGQHTLYVYAHSTFTDQWQLATRTFSVANTPPNVPTQATPTNGATVAGPTVPFSWQDPGDYDNRPRNYRDYMIEVKNGSGQVVAQMPWTATATWEANLADGTYSWHIQSGDGAVGSGWSADWSFTVSSTIVKPSNLAGEVTTGGIRLTWHDNATNELGYRVYRWRGEDLTWPLIGQAASTEFTDTQVVCGVTYFYLVSAFNNSGESEREGWVAVSMPGCPAPGSPLHPGVSSDESFATITWDAASGIVTGYNIYRLIDLGGSWDYTRVGQATAEQRSYTDIGLACESGYFYQISAYNPYGESARVDVPMAETTACSLAAPTGLHVSLADKGALMLAWNDDNLWEHGFNIYRWNGQQSIWERIGQREANLTTFADIGLACDSTYYYEVKAYRNERESGSAGWITTQTQACSAPKHSVFIPRAGK